MSINDRYRQIIQSPLSERVVKAYLPKVSEQDYDRGYLRRYFLQKTNDKGSPIYEISQQQKNTFINNPLYTVVDVKWRIRGPKENEYNDTGDVIDKSVSESNRIAIRLVGDKIPNLKLYLPNLLQFYKN